ncbi:MULTISPECIES: putative holin [Pseudomonas]|uniref:putative holin n=1 Tax=Pseudomonas TaxID=286 RepID=UPI00142F581F|nr:MULTISPECIES: putative holin [Pseudomonas]MBJ2225753.1 hypothetical protein [Pseudomonas sp. MF7451]MBW9236746.1 hypothetical protein [Pseudomonas carnis]NIL20078.1 hypothetical protein [Pseudomonas sp. AN3A02]NWD85700.1 hypothetical protein [Pseudomonas sp. K5002]
MAELSTGALAATATIGMTTASLIPGVDINAMIGGFAGAMFFVAYAKDLRPRALLGYFFASWALGYYVASEIISRDWAKTSGLVAFFGALFCVVICISLLEWFEGGKVPGWLRFIAAFFGRSGGRNG